MTRHFTLEEMTRTSVKGVENKPTEEQTENLRRVCRWLEQLRDEWNLRYGEGDDPVRVTSGFRSPRVNQAVGGVPTSNHLRGCAADIRVTGLEQLLRYAVILLDISDESREPFDELLLERNGQALWLHFAVRPEGNRERVRLT